MREHEVPTHVQAEDRVLLGLTFPQIVAVTALCALAYGLSRYAPGPSEVRIALAVVFGLGGVAMIAGRIGGRALPLVAGDLLRFGLGPRRYAGLPSLSQIERGERRPGPNLLKRLATLYGVDAYRLLRRAGHLGAGWTGDDPKADEPVEVERAYQYVLSDPMFRVGTRPDGPLSLNTKRFIVEMYERFTGKRLLE